MKAFWKIGLTVLVMLAVSSNLWAVTRIMDGTVAAALGVSAVTTEHQIGTGSWQNLIAAPKFEWYPAASSLFPGAAITVSQIQRIEYWTKNGSLANPTGLDFYFLIYTAGNTHNWYGERLTSEPMYYNNLNRSSTGWNHWNTDAGTNQMTWFDSNHSAQGYANAPTLAILQAGPIDWSAYPGGSGTVDYRNQTILCFSLQTGSAWDNVFDGFIDNIVITLYDGRVMVLDLEQGSGPVHNITQAVSYATIDEAVPNASSNDIIQVDPGTYPTGIVTAAVNLTLQASDNANPPTITPTANTPGVGSQDPTAGWFVVNSGVAANFEYLNFDAAGWNIGQVIHHQGPGLISHCGFSNVYHGQYYGIGVISRGSYSFEIAFCTFSNIERIGAHFNHYTASPKLYHDNTFTGKGAGLNINYACEVEREANVLIENNVVSNCIGVAGDGSTSAAFYATTYFGGSNPTTLEAHGNVCTNNTDAIAVGYDASDATVIEATGNKFEGNTYGVNSLSTVRAEAVLNWWGDAGGPNPVLLLSNPGHPLPMDIDDGRNSNRLDEGSQGLVHYSPWIASNGNDYDGGMPGWQPDRSVLGVSTNGTIQEGIDLVSGSTVLVSPGTYLTPQIVIASSLNLMSTGGAAVTIIDGTGGTGLVTAGTILITATDGDVTVDGFTLQNPSKSADYIGVHAYGNPMGVTYTVSNCVIHGTNDASNPDQKDFGIYFHGNQGSCVANNDVINQTNWNAILIETNPGPTDVNHCTWDRGIANTTNDGYFNMNHDAADVTSLQKVDYNTVNMGNVGPYDNDHRGFAITFAGAYTGTTGGFTNVQITNNTITNLQAYRRGIGLWNNAASGTNGDIVGTQITGNTITGASLTGTQGIRELGLHSGSVITGNAINGVGTAYLGAAWNGGAPSGTLLNTNNLADNTLGADWSGSGTLNAECNWWGTLNYANILAKTSGTVDFENWNDATLLNCTYNNTNTSDFTLSYDDSYVGCSGGAGCTDAILKVAFDRSGFVGGHLVITLPAGVIGNWTGNYQMMPPSASRSTNLNFLNAAGGGSGTITLDVSWQPPYSTGALGQYIAWLPVINLSATHGTYPSAIASYDYWDVNNVHHTADMDFALPELYVDCDVPTASLSGGGGGIFYGTEDSFLGALNVWTLAGTDAPVSPLAWASITLGGLVWTIPLESGAWPAGTETPNVWASMPEGCNYFTLTVTDAACNSVITPMVEIVKDVTGPVFDPANFYTQSACYNAATGAILLDTDMSITVAAQAECAASMVSLSFLYGAETYQALGWLGSVTGYPDATQAAALWTWLQPLLTGTSPASVTARISDVAGNFTDYPMSICWDFTPPANAFSFFDARPSSNGVWLKWTWSTADAVEAKIFRKGEGDYPVYAGNLWNADANYEKAFAVASVPANGWTEVATITGGESSALFAGTHGGPSNEYWKDPVASPRDIYRYITFVKDAGGNWSQVASYTIGTNADRSTNYWLGDFEPASPGVVNTADLSILSSDYFETTIAGGGSGQNQLDIGAENEENGVGKGIPNPDQAINFLDLIPFSFNFGVVMNGGFNVATPRANPTPGTDVAPVVTIARANQNLLQVGGEFDVIVSLSGNGNSAVKAVETQLTFDPQVLELVDVTSSTGEVYDGIPWSIARQIPGRQDQIGIAVAALGEIASFVEDFPMATITFRWVAERAPETSMQLEAYHILDVFGHTSEGEGPAVTFGANGAIPTEYTLYQNYPNPFNPQTLIRLDLPEASDVQLVIYNVMGQEVRTLVSATMPAGAHSITWNGLDNSGRPVGSGMYLYRVSAGPLQDIKKMMLTR